MQVYTEGSKTNGEVMALEVWTDQGRSWYLGVSRRSIWAEAHNATPCVTDTPLRIAYFFGWQLADKNTRALGIVWEPYTPVPRRSPPPSPPNNPSPPPPPPPSPSPPPFPPF